MKFIRLGLILSAAAFFVFACQSNQNTNMNGNVAVVTNNNAASNAATNTQPSAAPDELADTRKIYAATCVKCHKEDGSGGVTQLEDGKIKAPNFKSDHMMNDKDEDWIDAITNGIKDEGMPAFKGRLSDAEIKNLVKLIRKDFQGK